MHLLLGSAVHPAQSVSHRHGRARRAAHAIPMRAAAAAAEGAAAADGSVVDSTASPRSPSERSSWQHMKPVPAKILSVDSFRSSAKTHTVSD